MMVAMGIAAIFLSIFIGVVMATFQTLRTGDERTNAQQNARVAMRFIVQDIKQAVEIAPRRLEEPYDPVFGGMPRDENSIDQFDPFGTDDAYPIYRRTTDGDLAGDGYIDLSFDGAAGDGDEYDAFRTDGAPYDIRPLAPNRIELLLNTDSYYSHTQYFGDDPETLPFDLRQFQMDIDNGGAADNPQALRTRVTYEHQIAPPKVQMYVDEFDGNEKNFRIPLNRDDASGGVQVDEEFVIVRSTETEFLDDILNTDMSVPSIENPDMNVDSYAFRQPLADHVIDLRFRYWHVLPFSGGITNANTPMIEIRYDPDVEHAHMDPNGSSTTGIDTDDGYYRYFTPRGQEIFVWLNYDDGNIVEFVDPSLPDPFSPIANNSFIMRYRVDLPAGNEEHDRGILLFEGWRFINMVSVTIKTTNRENLDKFKSSIDHASWTNRDDDDYQMGFIDFGKGPVPPTGLEDRANPNVLDPFYRAVDSYRTDTRLIAGSYVYDFVEPNINPNYNPNSFVTIEMFVVPPIVKAISEQSEDLLWYGLSYIGEI